MNKLLVAAMLGLGSLCAAQTFTFPLNPRATYLRTNQDQPAAPLVLDLASIGAPAGTWLRVGTTGGFRYVNGGQDGFQSLCGVFSSNSTLLATNVQQRVPGAIAAGPSFPSANTYIGGLPMDVPQDFYCSRNAWADSTVVQVPAGATHLFLGVHDSLYNDNVDPNGDYAAVVSLAPTPAQPGTGEHLELRCSTGGATTSFPDAHTAAPNAPMLAEVHHPIGFVDGSIYVVLGDVIATGAPAPNLVPGLWVDELIVLQFGLVPSTPGWFATWTANAPAGFAGTTILVQAGALTTLARNGTFETTNAHRFELQ